MTPSGNAPAPPPDRARSYLDRGITSAGAIGRSSNPAVA